MASKMLNLVPLLICRLLRNSLTAFAKAQEWRAASLLLAVRYVPCPKPREPQTLHYRT